MTLKAFQKQDFLANNDPLSYDLSNEPLTVGALLKKVRLEKKQKISEVSHHLRVSERYLTAIEENDLSLLPEHVYTLGFVRSYAQYLGLDANEVVEQYKRENVAPSKMPPPPFPQASSGFGMPKLWVVILIGALLFLGGVFWVVLHFKQQPSLKQVEDVPAIIEELTPSVQEEVDAMESSSLGQEEETVKERELVTNLEKEEASSQTLPKTADQPGLNDSLSSYKDIIFKPGQKLTIQASALSWVGVWDQRGRLMINRNLKANETYEIEVQPGMKFSTGNAGRLRFVVEGKTTEPLGKEGEILRPIAFRFEE